MDISGSTRVCGIIGDPVTHSMSPAMHNASFEALGLDYVYVPLPVRVSSVAHCALAVRTFNLRGLNVTVPHKVAIMAQLDCIDPLAQRIGAVNTIVNDDGVLTGYNTDGPGFIRSLSEAGLDVRSKNVVVLGAGGAARAVVYSLVAGGASVTILNRNVQRAEALAHELSAVAPSMPGYAPLEHGCLRERLTHAHLLVNTTSVGMTPNDESSPCPSELLREDLDVCDIVYHPLKTRLLRDADAAGARVVSGSEMLVYQGAMAFELWTGIPAPVAVMRTTVLERLSRATG